jgi:hypothetical protein
VSTAPPVVVQDFESSLAFVLGAEGGLANDPVDKGGPTNLGITQAVYSEWLQRHGLRDAPVAKISHEEGDAVYHELFWNAGNCGSLPSPLNLCHFDGLVQHGPGAAGAILMAATWAAPGQPPEREAFAYLALRYSLYNRIVVKDPSQARFMKGWRNRLSALRVKAGL